MEIQDSEHAASDSNFTSQVEAHKKALLLDALRQTKWSKKDAAQKLGLSQRAMSHYVTKFNLDEFKAD
jgi:transcriptional regulator with GAF, ATPase, and Fis domain